MQKTTGFQILTGIWNPREKNYSWVVAQDHPALKPGHQEGGFYLDCYLLGIDSNDPLLSRSKVSQEAKAIREDYNGPPIALCVVTHQIIETIRNKEREISQ